MDKRYVAIWFQHLKTDWILRHNPLLRGMPVALAYKDHGKMRITEAGAQAVAKGIEAGMVVADAKVILPSLQIFDDDPARAEKLLKMLCAWAIRFTPAVSTDPPDGLLLDVTGCAHLWGGEALYLDHISRRLQELGYHTRTAMADTIGCAWAISRFGKHNAIIGAGQQKEALLPLPPAALRIDTAISDRLFKLGLYRIGGIINMEHRALRRRFGSRLAERLDQALGLAEETIIPLIPAEPYEERLPCLEPIQTRKGIEIALERLLKTLCDRLHFEGKGIRMAAFRGLRIDGKTVEMTISTNLPSTDTAHLIKLFEIKLEKFEPASGIELFMLIAGKVQELSAVQHTLWTSGSSLQSEEVTRLLDYIQGKFGRESVRRYLPAEHHMPERSIQPASSLTEVPAINWPTDRRRPVSLLQKPEKILVTAPVPDYPPMNFHYRGKLHTVKKADGPERIEPEWWLEEGLHRDYYVVEDEEGRRYWLFRSGHYHEERMPDWFMHGFFG